MLQTLFIKNYALIQELEIEPAATLNIITGETGAGKSIMLGAIGLLLGGRADTKVLYDESVKCLIEGTFQLKEYKLKGLFQELDLDYEETTIIRREITPSGKSRAFVNDSPVRLDALKQLGARLIDVHSQHDTLSLGQNEQQLNMVDIYGQHQQLVNLQAEKFASYKKAQQHYQKLISEQEKAKADLDYNQFLLKELEEANLDGLNQQQLEDELETMENADAIKQSLNLSLEYLSRSEYAVESGLKNVLQNLGQVSSYHEKFEALKERVNSSLIELQDIALELETEESELVPDQAAIAQLQEQLDQVYSLQKKHKVDTVEELIELRDDLQEKVEQVLNFDDSLEDAKLAMQEAEGKMMETAKKLSQQRLALLPTIKQHIDSLLHELGMPDARLELQHEHQEADESGIDKITFMFSANKGMPVREMSQVASGGEFSRLMLSIKYLLASKTALPTIVFDEIDTGVSGEIAIKMGKMMQEMAKNHQVVSISHLPQIAALGDQHYFVYKDNSAEKTVSRIKLLLEHERVNAIAQMIGGDNPSKTAFINARELMGME